MTNKYHRLGIQPYNKYSKSYNSLRKQLGLANYNEQDIYNVLINWGCKNNNNNYTKILNKHNKISNSSDKLLSYKLFVDNNIRTVKYTTNIIDAKNYTFPVFCRRNGLSGGRGITIANNVNEFVRADFYSEFIPKINEYRVHVFKGKIVSWSKKIPKEEVVYSHFICNHEHGYKFSKRLNSDCPELLSQLAIKAVNVAGLDFGSVDIIRDNTNHYYVLEINTASGMDGSTIKEYANCILEEVRNGS